MPIYEFTGDRLRELPVTQFSTSGLRERYDLQRVLRDQVELISPDTMILAEEFTDWSDSRRRIDLLGVDKQANLVVIELKRSDDGGHMELQAIRYAAMVSAMTFDKAVEVLGRYLRERGQNDENPTQTLLDFLGWSEPNQQAFGRDVRLVLASADFSKELTTAVLWLNDHDLDIRCVRLRPHVDGNRIFLDIHQLIPLAEASEYLVSLREKATEVREAIRNEAAWQGDWYVNLGMDQPSSPAANEQGQNYERHWEFCRKYGYVSAGGDPRYWKPLATKLNVGDRIWVYQKQAGYVGTGVVTHAAMPIHLLSLGDGSKLIDRLSRPDLNQGTDPDRYAYAVGVRWDVTVALDQAKFFTGVFANQNIVCKLTNEQTLAFLRKEFQVHQPSV
jgi:hypothetical protein